MQIIDYTITKKYALAYLKAYKDEICYETIKRIPILISLLKKYPSFIACLTKTSLAHDEKQKIIDTLTSLAQVNQSINILIDLLIKHKRLNSLISVLQSIIQSYNEKNNIVPVTIETSHKLNDEEKENIIIFIKKITQSNLLRPLFIINPSLISGIRIVSKNLLWEQSIDKVLKNIKHTMLQRIEL